MLRGAVITTILAALCVEVASQTAECTTLLAFITPAPPTGCTTLNRPVFFNSQAECVAYFSAPGLYSVLQCYLKVQANAALSVSQRCSALYGTDGTSVDSTCEPAKAVCAKYAEKCPYGVGKNFPSETNCIQRYTPTPPNQPSGVARICMDRNAQDAALSTREVDRVAACEKAPLCACDNGNVCPLMITKKFGVALIGGAATEATVRAEVAKYLGPQFTAGEFGTTSFESEALAVSPVQFSTQSTAPKRILLLTLRGPAPPLFETYFPINKLNTQVTLPNGVGSTVVFRYCDEIGKLYYPSQSTTSTDVQYCTGLSCVCPGRFDATTVDQQCIRTSADATFLMRNLGHATCMNTQQFDASLFHRTFDAVQLVTPGGKCSTSPAENAFGTSLSPGPCDLGVLFDKLFSKSCPYSATTLTSSSGAISFFNGLRLSRKVCVQTAAQAASFAGDKDARCREAAGQGVCAPQTRVFTLTATKVGGGTILASEVQAFLNDLLDNPFSQTPFVYPPLEKAEIDTVRLNANGRIEIVTTSVVSDADWRAFITRNVNTNGGNTPNGVAAFTFTPDATPSPAIFPKWAAFLTPSALLITIALAFILQMML